MADPRTQRKITRNLQSESRWLQKTLFALGKAREARAKVAEAKGKKRVKPLAKDVKGSVSLDDLEAIIKERVDTVREELGEGRPVLNR